MASLMEVKTVAASGLGVQLEEPSGVMSRYWLGSLDRTVGRDTTAGFTRLKAEIDTPYPPVI
jgi:hypothetical protein